MPKRRRLFTPNKNKIKNVGKVEPKSGLEKEVNTARGRLMGALMDVLDPTAAEDSSEETYEPTPSKQDRQSISEKREYLTDEEAKKCLRKSPIPQSYVLKLFDRSVDLSQFREDAPLYPICRAWIINQPKANYSTLGGQEDSPVERGEGALLPGPTGQAVSRVPPLLSQQRRADRDNINLDYHEAPPPSRDTLLRGHAQRWAAVRRAWLDQAAKIEARYEATQQILNKISASNTYLERPPVSAVYDDQ